MSLVVRRPRHAREFQALLRLRGEVFGRSWMAGHCHIDPDGIEWDPHDQCAHHIGLWDTREPCSAPVGVARMIGRHQVSTSQGWLALLGRTSPVPDRLPALADFCPDRDLGPPTTLEVSRFGLVDSHRATHIGARWALALAAVGLALGAHPLVFRVPHRDAARYHALVGATPLVSHTRTHQGVPVVLLHTGWSLLPEGVRAEIDRMAAHFLDHHEVPLSRHSLGKRKATQLLG